jgi:hypothetical protein
VAFETKLIPKILVDVLPSPFVPRTLLCDACFSGRASASNSQTGHALVIIEISAFLEVSFVISGKELTF